MSDNLLAYLRVELNDAGVSYCVRPTSLQGGYETQMFRFQLDNAPEELSGPLVLRVFPAYQGPERAIWECAVQNSLADQGYPAPQVYFAGTDAKLLGGPFVVMQFLPGETMLAAAPEKTPVLLGAAHATLHNLQVEPLIEALRSRGVEEQRLRFSRRLAWLSGRVAVHPWLAEAVQWLGDNRPPEPDQLSICHGDFHPLNILVDGDKVSAVLDWPGFSIADPAMDVAFTVVLLSIASSVLLPIENLDAMLACYYAAYDSVRPLDLEHLDYYRMVRCVMALVEGAEGQEVWTRPAVVLRLTEWIQEGAGIRVAVPGRAS
jgi:aminoglycoside phosphotransferase (APT) family kinase protein